MKLKLDKNIILLVTGAILISGVLVWLAIFVQLQKIRNMSDEIQKEHLNSQVKQERQQKILSLSKELGDVESKEKEMELMLVDKENAVPFLKTLENIAGETGNSIEINVFDLSKMKTKAVQKTVEKESDVESTKDIQKESQAKKPAQSKSSKIDVSNQLGFSLEIIGEYRSLVDFLSKLENAPYFTRVYNFTIALSENKSAPPAPEGDQSSQPAPEKKYLRTTLTLGVYTHGK